MPKDLCEIKIASDGKGEQLRIFPLICYGNKSSRIQIRFSQQTRPSRGQACNSAALGALTSFPKILGPTLTRYMHIKSIKVVTKGEYSAVVHI